MLTEETGVAAHRLGDHECVADFDGAVIGSGSPADRPLRLQRFGVWLKTKGYDGIEYRNEHEAVGSTSIAVADPAHLFAGPVEALDMLELRALFDQVKDRPKYATCRDFPST